MVRLITSYYTDSNIDRQNEINECLKFNIDNKFIDEIILLCENEHPFQNSKKITSYPSKRPTFYDFLLLINKITKDNDFNIMSNTDIFFDESLLHLRKYPLNNKILCLLRWEKLMSGKSNIPVLRSDCQDSWIFKGKIEIKNMWLDFQMGKLGCDNRVCYEFKNAGYKLENPCHLIKSYHLHNIKKRNYKETLVGEEEHKTNKDVIPPPYAWVDPL